MFSSASCASSVTSCDNGSCEVGSWEYHRTACTGTALETAAALTTEKAKGAEVVLTETALEAERADRTAARRRDCLVQDSRLIYGGQRW